MKLIIPTWAPAARFGDWALYQMPNPTTEGTSFLWWSFKLLDTSGAAPRWGRQRSFRLRWNPVEGRRRRDSEGARLHAQEPALEAEVDAFMRATYDRAWLTTEGMVDEAEIEPELARLAAMREARRGR